MGIKLGGLTNQVKPALSVDALTIKINTQDGAELVSDVSLSVSPGECLGLVGESGSGKSLILRAVLDLLPSNLDVAAGSINIDPDNESKTIKVQPPRNRGVGLVPQEPMTALNPSMRVGTFLEKCIRRGQLVSRKEAHKTAVSLLRDLGMPDPEQKMRAWPHELSGGLRQRILIAAALASEPKVLLCDEPTTALDVTIQDQILGLIDGIRLKRDLAVVFVTHDLGVVSKVAQRIAVMYAGRIVEVGPVQEIFSNPQHPYTRALLEAIPDISSEESQLTTIPGNMPLAGSMPPGCRFAPRCPFADEACTKSTEELYSVNAEQSTACIAPERMKTKATKTL